MGLLDGKRALVAGVANSNSIAWGIATALHAHGARIAFTCLPGNVRRLKKLAPQVDSDIIIPCNVQSDEEIEQALKQVGDAFGGKLDILVHAIAFANIADLEGEFINISKDGWNLALEISAYSFVAFTRYARPLMRAAGGGSVMTLSFAGGDMIVPGYNVMGIAKAALNSAVRYLSYDIGPENIRVNAISPGPIRTLSSMMVSNFDKAMKLNEENSPLLRNVTPEDVGRTAVFLASELSEAITGTILDVDAGMSNVCAPSITHPKFKKAFKAEE